MTDPADSIDVVVAAVLEVLEIQAAFASGIDLGPAVAVAAGHSDAADREAPI